MQGGLLEEIGRPWWTPILLKVRRHLYTLAEKRYRQTWVATGVLTAVTVARTAVFQSNTIEEGTVRESKKATGVY
jgi:hypothetical protein